METCKVEFINQDGQKIVLNFSLYENGELEYKPSFEPKVDPKTNNKDINTKDERSNQKLES